jgi:hypothetical protein
VQKPAFRAIVLSWTRQSACAACPCRAGPGILGARPAKSRRSNAAAVVCITGTRSWRHCSECKGEVTCERPHHFYCPRRCGFGAYQFWKPVVSEAAHKLQPPAGKHHGQYGLASDLTRCSYPNHLPCQLICVNITDQQGLWGGARVEGCYLGLPYPHPVTCWNYGG